MSAESAEKQTLTHLIGSEPPRAEVVSECVDLVGAEVKAKRGFSGAAIKTAYGTIKRIKPKFVSETVDALLDDWLEKIEPHYQEWRSGQSGTFAAFVEGRAEQVAEDLLTVTDERAEGSKHGTAAKLYFKMRPKALANVTEAVPKLGALIERKLDAS